jgi:tetrahydromethanopterin S-methyltransferase subunit G
MSIISQDQKRLDNIAKAYWNTSGEMRQMWGRKWYELIKQIGRKLDEAKRLTTDSRKIH